MAKEPKLTEWSKGKPTMVGEYNASTQGDKEILRWWNGEGWSYGYRPNDPAAIKRRLRRAMAMASTQRDIKWRGLVEQPEYSFPPGPLGKL